MSICNPFLILIQYVMIFIYVLDFVTWLVIFNHDECLNTKVLFIRNLTYASISYEEKDEWR